MDESEETEIKLVASSAMLEALANYPALRGVERQLHLRTVYFDTMAGRLWARGAALRVREGPDGRELTLKTGSAKGPSSRREFSVPMQGEIPEPGLLPAPARDFLTRAIGDCPIAEIAASDMVRRLRQVRHGSSRIEVAFDQGTLIAGSRKEQVCELELELADGSVADLFRFALELPLGPELFWSVRSKGERCHDLAFDVEPAAEKARALKLLPAMSIDLAFQKIARNSLRQLLANYPLVIASGDPDAIHQTRVAVRRLRAAISIFAEFVAHEETPVIRAGLKAVADALAGARDLHVAVERLEMHNDEVAPHAEELATILKAHRDRAVASAQMTLNSNEFQRFLFALAEWIETSPWVGARPSDSKLPQVGTFAKRELRRRIRKIARHSGRIAAMDDKARHRLRIATKKLRYAWEFFRSLYGSARPEVRASFSKGLERLQESLGELNDIAVAAAAAPNWLAGEEPITTARLNVVMGNWLDERRKSAKRLVRQADKALSELTGWATGKQW